MFNDEWAHYIKFRCPEYKNDVVAKRQAFVDFIDALHRDGEITDRQANTWTNPFWLKIMNFDDFQDDPRDYAEQLVEEGYTTEGNLLIACLKFMSYDRIREMLDDNELSPRFIEGRRFD